MLSMRSRLMKLAVVVTFALASTSITEAGRSAVDQGTRPAFQSIGPLAFAPDGTLFAADTQAASIVALDLGASTGAPGTKDIAGVDQKIAAMLGTDAKSITITDLAVHPKTHQSYLSVMRGQGPDAKAALMKVDGAGALSLVATESLKFSKVSLPNAPDANPTTGRSNRSQSVTHLAYTNGRVIVAGLSNEEFSSKLWSVAYPFSTVDRGTSVEIFHTNHNRIETASPVYAFVPYTINNEQYIIGGYLCTPLVKFPMSALKAGEKVHGVTIAELGAQNRPIDMILYRKDGKEFLLMSNTARGVMKIPTADFGAAPALTTVVNGTAGIAYETIATMKGIEQLDLLDATHSIVIAKGDDGARNLMAVILP
jgi:hypothetical protein